jgi:hypothetical protein
VCPDKDLAGHFLIVPFVGAYGDFLLSPIHVVTFFFFLSSFLFLLKHW